MEKLSFVVASMPRSGTAYTAQLLRSSGIRCGHEEYFHPTTRTIDEKQDLKLDGDASWMAAPFLRSLPKDTIIIHQIRDPLQSLNSLIYTGHLDIEVTGNSYIDFIKRHVPFPSRELPQADLAMFFWSYWHRLIERSSTGHPYFRCRVEEISADVLGQILRRNICPPITHIPTDYNTRGLPIQYLELRDLSDDILEMAAEYGYNGYGEVVPDNE